LAFANVDASRDPIATNDYNLSLTYWMSEYPNMAAL
jgi:hypothetical protein